MNASCKMFDAVKPKFVHLCVAMGGLGLAKKMTLRQEKTDRRIYMQGQEDRYRECSR